MRVCVFIIPKKVLYDTIIMRIRRSIILKERVNFGYAHFVRSFMVIPLLRLDSPLRKIAIEIGGSISIQRLAIISPICFWLVWNQARNLSLSFNVKPSILNPAGTSASSNPHNDPGHQRTAAPLKDWSSADPQKSPDEPSHLYRDHLYRLEWA